MAYYSTSSKITSILDVLLYFAVALPKALGMYLCNVIPLWAAICLIINLSTSSPLLVALASAFSNTFNTCLIAFFGYLPAFIFHLADILDLCDAPLLYLQKGKASFSSKTLFRKSFASLRYIPLIALQTL
uniref:Uncharacterized protein ORF-c10_018 n=1 Tax=Saccharolobus solfataricus TaxID=2287 RepID=Q9UXA1_SACSO|nr:hypothetical protein [Saccharolobus solfataricus P2]